MEVDYPNYYGPYAKTNINLTGDVQRNTELAIMRLVEGNEEDYMCFMFTIYWRNFIYVWAEINPPYCAIRKLYVKRKDLQETDVDETRKHRFVSLRGKWYEVEKAAFTTRYQDKRWETNLDEIEEMAKHGAEILNEFFKELGRPAEYEFGAEAMAQKDAELKALATKRGKAGKAAKEKIAENDAAAIAPADAVELAQWYFGAQKTLFDHCLVMIDRLRKEVGGE